MCTNLFFLHVHTKIYMEILKFGREPDPSIDTSSHVTQLCRELGGVTICRKGQEDILADGKDGKI